MEYVSYRAVQSQMELGLKKKKAFSEMKVILILHIRD